MLKINCKITQPPAANKRLHALHATAPRPLKLSSPRSCHLCLLALCSRGSWCPLKTPPALNNNSVSLSPATAQSPLPCHPSPTAPACPAAQTTSRLSVSPSLQVYLGGFINSCFKRGPQNPCFGQYEDKAKGWGTNRAQHHIRLWSLPAWLMPSCHLYGSSWWCCKSGSIPAFTLPYTFIVSIISNSWHLHSRPVHQMFD